MKKLMLVAAMLALVVALAVPAVAQVSNEIGQESESGDLNVAFEASSSGDYAMQCVAPLQFGNTGNTQNAQGFAQYASTADDIEFGGTESEFFTGPGAELSFACDQAVQQSAAASG